MTIVFHSTDVFGELSKGQLFMIDALRWIPTGVAAWVFKKDQRPGLVRLRENRAYGLEVAATLIEEKKRELKNGASRKDILSLLGSSRVTSLKLDRRFDLESVSQGEFHPEARSAARRRRNHRSSPVKYIFLPSAQIVRAHLRSRTIMFAGHETTARTVSFS